MLINLRNALMAGKRLPYDAEVEYLESTGTQWIDTGIIVDSSITSAQISLAPTNKSSGDNILFGSRDSGYGIYCFAGSSALRTRWGGPTYVDISYSLGDVIDVNIHNGSVTVTNRATGAYRSFAVGNVFKPYPLVIAGTAYGSSVQISTGVRLLRVKIGDVRDFIPVRKGTVGYLYDRVSGKLFGNAGTGDFVLGQDVVPMTWQDGLQYNNVGTPVESATSSIGLDYIPITAGHSFTWRLGYGSSASADLIIYNANKERIDYWVARDRTVTISGAAAYMRISALTSYKEQATVYDETAQKYVFANGRIPAE